ncbi:hypothetical protein QOZ80_2AG0101690 [Eleusine coracana subsp. coracana]|nr:hypothetical protein QOZ80_2AG0101690 [Eleusine coracana subsp. coracana]
MMTARLVELELNRLADFDLPIKRHDLVSVLSLLPKLQSCYLEIAEMPVHFLTQDTKALAADLRDVPFTVEHIFSDFRARIQTLQSAKLRGLKRLAPNLYIKLKIHRYRCDFVIRIRKFMRHIKALHFRCRVADLVGRSAMADDGGQEVFNPDTQGLVGVDVRRDELVKILTQEGATSQRKLVAVVGDGPLGKTTLAKAVYDWLTPQYDIVAWVEFSSLSGTVKSLWDILHQISQEPRLGFCKLLNPQEICDKIRITLQDKRYHHLMLY